MLAQKNVFSDSHCHLNHPDFCFRLPEILQEARAAGVARFFSVCAQYADWQQVLDFSRQYAQIVPVCGIHPLFLHSAPADWAESLEKMLQQNPRVIVGEIGLDFYSAASRTPQVEKNQEKFFRTQLHIAQKYRRPVVLHQRRATERCLKILRDTAVEKGIAHAFSGSIDSARAFLKQGLLIGIGTTLLRDNARKIKEVLRFLPEDGFVLETDAPFMCAQNRPAQIAAIARAAAAIRQVSVGEIARMTEENMERLLAF